MRAICSELEASAAWWSAVLISTIEQRGFQSCGSDARVLGRSAWRFTDHLGLLQDLLEKHAVSDAHFQDVQSRWGDKGVMDLTGAIG